MLAHCRMSWVVASISSPASVSTTKCSKPITDFTAVLRMRKARARFPERELRRAQYSSTSRIQPESGVVSPLASPWVKWYSCCWHSWPWAWTPSARVTLFHQTELCGQ
uniref:Uncharacterized protein n=1 Tax=Ixodes ricinus TaxID=34613 RepID=A0A6B0UIP9_IXORI